jgi:LysM repeat protein
MIIPGGVEPIPSDGSGTATGGFIDDSGVTAGSVEPFPEGSQPATGGSAPSGKGGVACGRRVVYVVRPGDNLFRIALRYRTTTLAIARLNHIPDVREISVGQRLVIVTCRQGGWSDDDIYVVRPGDNLFRIALRHGTTAAAIRWANGLHSNLIVPGQVLRIP